MPGLPRLAGQAEKAHFSGVARAQAAHELAKKLGVEIKQVYLTTGASDLLLILEATGGDNVAKFALALSAQGNVHTRTSRAWPEADFQKIIAALP